MTTKMMAIAVAAFALMGSAAQAAVVAQCSTSDIVSPVAVDCRGFFAGQLLGGNPGDIAAQKAALLQLGFNWDGLNFGSLENHSGLSGAHSLVTSQLLFGDTYIGMHFGGGQGGPGNATAFYKLDAGSGTHDLSWVYNASSDVIIYSTGTPGVPEPATWALMISGFGLAGAALRRRRVLAA